MMSIKKRYTAREALDKLLSLDEDNSGDESVPDSVEEEDVQQQEEIENEQSDEDSSEEDIRPLVQRIGATRGDDVEMMKGRDGTKWKRITGKFDVARAAVHNIFRARTGPTALARQNIMKDSPYSAFKLMINEKMLRNIQRCTEAEGNRVNGNWTVSLGEIETFIGLCYAKGVLCGSKTPRRSLWSDKYGIPIFKDSMTRDAFEQILRYMRFEQRSERKERLKQDKFALASEVWNDFIDNCRKNYVPECNLSIDEQLFPTKARCRFTQYMGQKPDKFGIKFWLLAEVDSKYLWNGMPYLGKDDQRPEGVQLAHYVVTQLATGLEAKGYHITYDNFFTSLALSRNLKGKSITSLGTIRCNRRELPSIVQEMSKKNVPRYQTEVLTTDDGITLTAYKAKCNKIVLLLSSQHQNVKVDNSDKKKPETITMYNNTKFGVDCLDQMAKHFTTKAGTRRWPLAVFFNILDFAGINSWILYKMCTGAKISRRQYLLLLVEEIISMTKQPAPLPRIQLQPPEASVRTAKRKQCHYCRNKTNAVCHRCSKMVCGKCTVPNPVTCKNC